MSSKGYLNKITKIEEKKMNLYDTSKKQIAEGKRFDAEIETDNEKEIARWERKNGNKTHLQEQPKKKPANTFLKPLKRKKDTILKMKQWGTVYQTNRNIQKARKQK